MSKNIVLPKYHTYFDKLATGNAGHSVATLQSFDGNSWLRGKHEVCKSPAPTFLKNSLLGPTRSGVIFQ